MVKQKLLTSFALDDEYTIGIHQMGEIYYGELLHLESEKDELKFTCKTNDPVSTFILLYLHYEKIQNGT